MKAVVRNHDDLVKFCSRVATQLGTDFGKPYTVSIAKFKRPRSLEQNKKLHAMLRELALHTGYTESMMKEICKANFGPIAVYQVGNRIVDAPKGTSDYTVEEMADFVESLYQLGAEIGVVFSDD